VDAAALGELLRFRHGMRHLYAYELEPGAVSRLLLHFLGIWPRVRQECSPHRSIPYICGKRAMVDAIFGRLTAPH
jgi:hypothetical protein